MEDDKIQYMWWREILTTLVLAMICSSGNGAICPAPCKCQEDVLRTSCASASLEVVPIQLNPELHELDLSNNKIVHIHFSFPFYEKLVSLNLSSNRIKGIGNSNFNSQRNLTHLDLSSNQLENLTKDSLKGLKALIQLDLSNNSIEDINAGAFRELHSLSVLRLSGNRLMHLEESLFRSCKNLRELYLSDNQFLEVPTAALTDTIQLWYLSLSRNLILSVEDGDMANLPELHTLLLDSNVISNLHPDGLSSLVTLDYLDLSDNNLTAVPTVPLDKLASLTTLKLSGNFISHIPHVAFRGLFHLRLLKIDYLETLEQIDSRAFIDNINLEEVHMDYNVRMEKLPTRLFHGNPKIKIISVRYNDLQTLEAIHFPIDQLYELRIGGNPLICNCSLGWLWHLIQKHQSNSIRINESVNAENGKNRVNTSDLTLDVTDISCAGPDGLNSQRLADVASSQMDCSVGWMAAVSVTLTLIFSLLVIGGVVYCAPRHRARANKKEISEIEDTMRRNVPTHSRRSEPYETAQIEKYILPSHSMIDEYNSLPPWDPYGANAVNIYEQLNENGVRPHIVYV